MSFINKQIYILDDDISVVRALKILLSAYGYQVTTYDSVQGFFDTVPNNARGCLILDIHMPGLDGWEVQQHLSKSGSKLLVVVISADKNGGLKERVLKAGAVGYLQKPFMDKELVALIQQAFDPKRK